jgi:glycosyltransferase involved in cell wall biosynthesis
MYEPLVSVYITSHNYGNYLEAAIKSVLNQTYKNIEILIFDDNSTDNSPQVIDKYLSYPNVQANLSNESNGLRKACNICIKSAKGDFVIRLDADDILHEDCIQNMVSKIKKSVVKLDFIFSNYFYLSEDNKVLGVELIQTNNGVYEATSLPPHGACCLVAKSVYEKYGYYDETIQRQDGHELWIKMIQNNISYSHIDLPLWYYRKHRDSLSSNSDLVHQDRRVLKQKLNHNGDPAIAFIPILKTIFDIFDPIMTNRLTSLVNEIKLSKKFKSIVISSDSLELKKYCLNNQLEYHDRSELLADQNVDIIESLKNFIFMGNIAEEIFCIVNLTSVNVRKDHLQELVNTFYLYNSDSVISVYPENGIMYKMNEFGLQPINYDNQFKIRKDRDYVYIFNGALRIFKSSNIIIDDPFGKRIGHIEMSIADSKLIKTSDQAKRFFRRKNNE